MSAPSVRVILGAGLIVLAAQLVVWLTPARYLFINNAENPPALDAGGQNRAQVPSARRPADESKSSEVATKEPTTAAGERVAQAPLLQAGEVGITGTKEAPVIPEPEAKSDISPPQAEETPTPAEDTVAENLASPEPEAKSDTSVPDAEETPGPTEDTVAENLASPKPEAKSDINAPDAEETPAPAQDTTAQAPAPDKLFIVDAIRSKLTEPALREGTHADDLTALEAFYAGYQGPARWLTGAGLTPQAQSIVTEIAKADDWGLDASDFQVPPPDFQASVAEDQAAMEVAIDVAILKYARAAQGGRTEPSAINKVFAQKPHLRDPGTVLTEIFAAPASDAYLRNLHPKHAQFERLRQALLKARAEGEAKADDQEKLRVNMERWRWMPSDLGAIHVWLNIPEFMINVVKDGKVIHSQKAVVGSPNAPTPALSADLKSIVFNPYRVVPTSVIRKKVLPALKKDRNWFGRGKTSVLKQFQLEVKRKGKPIDPTKIDWENENLANFTFLQAPGPTNAMGKVQFLFPNSRAVDLRATAVPSQLKRTVRAVGPKSPRVGIPGKFAGALLTEDKGWGAAKIAKLMADGKNTSVKLDHPIPIHMTYFTVVADDEGNVRTIADVYGLDAAVEAAIRGEAKTAPSTSDTVPIPPRKPATEGTLATRKP
jgi:murein L,D-transpeptidase YcbB/YkuD